MSFDVLGLQCINHHGGVEDFFEPFLRHVIMSFIQVGVIIHNDQDEMLSHEPYLLDQSRDSLSITSVVSLVG